MSSSSGDLVERLRNLETSDPLGNGDFGVCHSAADEIERLREQLRLANIDQFNAEARLAEAEQLLRLAYRFVVSAYDGRTVEASIHSFLAGEKPL